MTQPAFLSPRARPTSIGRCLPFVQLVFGVMALSRSCRNALSHISHTKHFHTCSVLAARKAVTTPSTPARSTRRAVPNLEPFPYDDDLLSGQLKMEDDAPEPTHKYLQQQRELLYYLRLIEHEMPKLVGTSDLRMVFGVLLTRRTMDSITQHTASRLFLRALQIRSSFAQYHMVARNTRPLKSVQS